MSRTPIERHNPGALRNNILLRSLSPSDAHLLKPHLSRTVFRPGEMIAGEDSTIDRAIFPETMIVSFRDGDGESRPDVAMIGREGMIGWQLLLGVQHSPLVGKAQMRGGAGWTIRARPLLDACHISTTLQASLLRFVHNFIMQMAATIGSGSHPVERRVARWLLMLHDRADDDVMNLTHDTVAAALSVRRASVTDCLHLLEGEHVVKCDRGRIAIRDRPRLEAVAGNCYGPVEAHYAREIGGGWNAGPAGRDRLRR